MTLRNPLYYALGLTVVLAVLIAVLTLVPIRGPKGLPVSDKRYHFIAFAALTLPLATVRPRLSLVLIALVALYGGAIELVQPYVGRSKEWADWVADLAGAVAGGMAGVLIHRVFNRLRAPVSG